MFKRKLDVFWITHLAPNRQDKGRTESNFFKEENIAESSNKGRNLNDNDRDSDEAKRKIQGLEYIYYSCVTVLFWTKNHETF